MRRGFAPGAGISFVAETRTVRFAEAVSYWTMSCPPCGLAALLGISAEGSTVVYSAPSCSQRAGPKGAAANSCLLNMRSSVEVNCGESCAKAAGTARSTARETMMRRRDLFTEIWCAFPVPRNGLAVSSSATEHRADDAAHDSAFGSLGSGRGQVGYKGVG